MQNSRNRETRERDEANEGETTMMMWCMVSSWWVLPDTTTPETGLFLLGYIASWLYCSI